MRLLLFCKKRVMIELYQFQPLFMPHASYHSDDIHIIYAGGTFGSHGLPLSPLPADVFLPTLVQLLNTRLEGNQVVLENTCIKDSSSLNPSDFVHFFNLISTAHQQGAKRFILITGTDTLSFLASFLSCAFANNELSLVITGSMTPLLVSDNPIHQINDDGDAWHNLSEAIDVCKSRQGVFVQFFHQTFWADNTQKVDSQNPNAFFGATIDKPKSAFTPINKKPTSFLKTQAKNTHIQSVFILPNHADDLACQLANIDNKTKAVILIAFGAGNLPKTQHIIDELERLHANHIPVVCTTMCAFHGVSDVYEAGAWQYKHHVWSGGQLSIPAIYGRLLWLCVNDELHADFW